MTGMLTLRADKWVRIGAGGALLLLLLAQQKLCPWLLAPPAPADPAPAEADTATANEDKEEQQRQAARLPHLLPDAAAAPAPRWSASWDADRHRATTGWHEGVVACGPRDQGAPPTVAVSDEFNWHVFLCPVAPAQRASLVAGHVPAIHAVLITTILRTGPPLA